MNGAWKKIGRRYSGAREMGEGRKEGGQKEEGGHWAESEAQFHQILSSVQVSWHNIEALDLVSVLQLLQN